MARSLVHCVTTPRLHNIYIRVQKNALDSVPYKLSLWRVFGGGRVRQGILESQVLGAG